MNRRKMLIASLVIGALGAMPVAYAADKGLVGVSMPTKSSARWIDDGNNMVKELKGAGYSVDLQYAEDDIPNQLAQIENMVTKGVKVLVIASIDGTTLSDVLQKAADKGVKGPPDQEVEERRLLRHVRQLQGWRSASPVAGRCTQAG